MKLLKLLKWQSDDYQSGLNSAVAADVEVM